MELTGAKLIGSFFIIAALLLMGARKPMVHGWGIEAGSKKAKWLAIMDLVARGLLFLVGFLLLLLFYCI